MNQIKEIELEKSVITLYDNRIVKIRFLTNISFELEDAVIANQTMHDLAEGKPFLSLVDTFNVRSQISKAAMDHFAKDPLTKGVRLAEALVINSLHNRILASFYAKLTGSHSKTKVFAEFAPAIDWLLKIYKEQEK